MKILEFLGVIFDRHFFKLGILKISYWASIEFRPKSLKVCFFKTFKIIDKEKISTK